MAEATYRYEVSVTVDPEVWQATTGARPEPYIKELILDLLRASCVGGAAMMIDVRVDLPVPVKVTKFEEIE